MVKDKVTGKMKGFVSHVKKFTLHSKVQFGKSFGLEIGNRGGAGSELGESDNEFTFGQTES